MLPEIKLSVRTLVEYVFSSGSIDNQFRTATTMTEGTKAHKAIQKTYADTDQKEVPLKTEIEYESMVFLIEGRCDGVIFREEEILIDEIKSTSKDLSRIDENTNPVHWAQAKVYAYIYAKDHDLQEMSVQLTYVQNVTDEQKKFKKNFTFLELQKFVRELVEKYAPFALLMEKHRLQRDQSIQKLAFPFAAFRKGQRKLAGAIYKTISEEKNIFANAPTGIGKTISTIFPTVKAMGEGKLERMFYLTAKTITRQSAEDAFLHLKKNGLCMSAVTITAKEKVCFKEETICQKEYCEFANGYYDRINEAVLDIFTHETFISRSTIEEYARKHQLCPFEFSLDLAFIADAVICDYNYIFDPKVSLKRFFDEHKKNSVLLIDEAHNLVDRAREMFSADLSKSNFLALKREYKGSPVHDAVTKLNQYFIDLKKKCSDKGQLVLRERQEDLVELLEEFVHLAEMELLSYPPKSEQQQLLLDTYFEVTGFVRISKLYDERHVTYVETEKNDVFLKMFCLDPSYLLQQVRKKFRTTVHFSATLLPLPYFIDMLGGSAEDYRIKIPSLFAKEQNEVFIQRLSTRYQDREHTKNKLVRMISELVSKRSGNYLIFFPSYQYMKSVYEDFTTNYPEIRTILQTNKMDEEKREQFLAEFKEDGSETLLGFAVLGGVFSEGVDLKGDRLNGVIVVGVGHPQVCLERNVMKEYFQSTGKNGYDYAYTYPGINKVIQAGGRLIRSEKDTGTIVLVDDRFLSPKYQQLLPVEWGDFRVI
ncbi:ATP-dependent DNA helicase [Mesobacillus maritimus]|uniref:helicase C-terminal domain-containing protein n=1 Tax=Mesobacillus maritimus TaxID=1643336 RepID=UPI002041F1E8|nr:helicase C-terminal domain-containing protein [Mesobacillus maritimus]MCM3584776.1 ATP-dependent DNA helicase [Mesobacillus maritimus]MCM3671858.1 ATP-dependent DNA helicase [Mesobacillus maritimus]